MTLGYYAPRPTHDCLQRKKQKKETSKSEKSRLSRYCRDQTKRLDALYDPYNTDDSHTQHMDHQIDDNMHVAENQTNDIPTVPVPDQPQDPQSLNPDIHPEDLRQFLGTNPIQRTHTQDFIQKQMTESSDLSASGPRTLNELSQKAVDLHPDYLRYISSLSQSKVAYISDSSDCDY